MTALESRVKSSYSSIRGPQKSRPSASTPVDERTAATPHTVEAEWDAMVQVCFGDWARLNMHGVQNCQIAGIAALVEYCKQQMPIRFSGLRALRHEDSFRYRTTSP